MRIKTAFIVAPFIIMGWIGVLAVVAFVSDEAPAYVVLFPSQILVENISESSSILAASVASVTLTSDEAGFARSLYRNGAWLVLPAGLTGCSPQAKTS